MKKSKRFQSPFSYLMKKNLIINNIGEFYYKKNIFDVDLNKSVVPKDISVSPFDDLFLGGVNTLIAMRKDFIDTFKPFKAGSFYVTRDLMQPIRGVGNILNGIFNIIVSPTIFLINTFRYIYLERSKKNVFTFSFLRKKHLNLARTAGGFLFGCTNLLRGITQVVTTPLTWLLRMPFRALLGGRPTVIDSFRNESFKAKAVKIEALTLKPKKSLEEAQEIDFILGSVVPYKLQKAFERNNRRKMDPSVLHTTYKLQDSCEGFKPFVEKPWVLNFYKLPGQSLEFQVVDNQEKQDAALNMLSILMKK